MPLYINIELDGIKPISRRINGIVGKVKDLRPVFKKIGKDFRETEEKVFNSQGAYGSRPAWTPLSPKYKEWKDKHYPGKPILQQTGKLKTSLSRKGGNHVEVITKNSITLGTKDYKFKWHQKGTPRMPERPPITFTQYQGNKWAKMIRNHILSGAKK